jgi:hypothetical protein
VRVRGRNGSGRTEHTTFTIPSVDFPKWGCEGTIGRFTTSIRHADRQRLLGYIGLVESPADIGQGTQRFQPYYVELYTTQSDQ